MSKNNIELLTMAEARHVAGVLNAVGIGGGVVDIYDIGAIRDSGLQSVFGKTIDPEDPSALFLGFTFANGATGISAGLCQQTIKNNPGRWADMLTLNVNAQAKERRHESD